MLIQGSCLALNLSYYGCCVWSLSPPCSNNGCYCDENCHNHNDCYNDLSDIGCHPASSSSPTVSSTISDTLGKTNQKLINTLVNGFLLTLNGT